MTTEFMSLSKPHLLWLTCGDNPFEVNKAVIQAKMLSGRYVTDKLSRHWTSNKGGLCMRPDCSGLEIGSLEHLLIFCQALSWTWEKLVDLWLVTSKQNPEIYPIITSMWAGQDIETFTQFLLDCSCLPQVVRLQPCSGLKHVSKLFYLTRSWCYSIHRSRMIKLGLKRYL